MLTFINTSTRRAWIAKIRNRRTGELIDKIELWINKVETEVGKIHSIATDNEFYKNRRITRLFELYGIRHYVEIAHEHSKLGIINRFHRTFRDLLTKMMVHNRSDRWVDFVSDAIFNYNRKINRVLGKAPMDMNWSDIAQLNRRLMLGNRASVRRMQKLAVGDRVRYLIAKSIFAKGGTRYSESIWNIIAINRYIVTIEYGERRKEKKYWELQKVEYICRAWNLGTCI